MKATIPAHSDIQWLIKELDGDLPSPHFLMSYKPRKDWILHESRIHGLGHIARVLILQELLARLLVKDGITLDQEGLRWAATFHDLRRVNDGLDPEHRKRARDWLLENMPDMIPRQSFQSTVYCAEWHVTPDSQTPTITPDLAIFKDADGLDRVRISDLNPSYLRHSLSRHLIHIAETLYVNSFKHEDYESNPFEAVLNTAIPLGIIKNAD